MTVILKMSFRFQNEALTVVLPIRAYSAVEVSNSTIGNQNFCFHYKT